MQEERGIHSAWTPLELRIWWYAIPSRTCSPKGDDLQEDRT